MTKGIKYHGAPVTLRTMILPSKSALYGFVKGTKLRHSGGRRNPQVPVNTGFRVKPGMTPITVFGLFASPSWLTQNKKILYFIGKNI
jgi:hypothetical protein